MIEALTKRVYKLEGARQEMLNQKASLIIKAESATQVVDMHKAVVSRLDELQEKATQQSAGVYNELLTAIVHDVMQDVEQEIVLKTEVKNNKTQLYIGSNKNGQSEDIVDDRGGSINNLISAGLRFIAIVQSGNRRFVAMDEQDCWLEEQLVPRFIEVLSKLSKEIGVQCVFISHHERDDIQEKCAVVEIQHKQGKIEIKSIRAKSEDAPIEHKMGGEWFEGTGIRYIKLNNIMSHEDSTIPLSSSMTALVGGNDIGKSVVIRAISALKDNAPKYSLISHTANEGSVRFGLEDGMELLWSIAKDKKGNKVTTPQYTLFNADGKIMKTETATAGSLPQWVDSILAMGSKGKLDSHIGHQKDPLFILNPVITPAQRAEMVDLGNEFHIVQKMFSIHNENVKAARREIKASNAEIALLNRRLEQLSALTNVNVSLESLSNIDDEINVSQSQINESKEMMDLLTTSFVDAGVIDSVKAMMANGTDTKFIDISQGSALLADIQVDESHMRITEKLKSIGENHLRHVDVGEAYQLREKLMHNSDNAISVANILHSIANTQIKPAQSKAGIAADHLASLEDEIATATTQKEAVNIQQVAIDQEWEQAVKDHGSHCPCPTCGHSLSAKPF
jgi:hypothetical protein